MFPIRVKTVQESDLRMLGSLARNIQRVLPVTQADIDAAAALGKGWVVWKVFEVSDPLDNLRGGTQLIIRQNSIQPGQNVRRVIFVAGPGGQTVVIRGTDYIALPDAIANSLQYVKVFGGTEQRSKLPEEYTQLAYIGSSGSQYIDLGYKGNGNTKVDIKFKYHTLSSATGSGRAFGSRTSISSNAFAVGTSSGVVTETTNTLFWCYDNQPYFASSEKFGLDVWKTVVFSATEHSIDGVSVGNDYEVVEFETPQNLKLFGFDNNGSMGFGYVDVAYCKLWDNGVLVRDLIPAKRNSDNVLGMYDAVTGNFLTNDGTDTFTAGGAAVPTPDVPMDIVSNNGVLKASRNLFNDETVILDQGTITVADAAEEGSANRVRSHNYIPVTPNTTYILSGVISGSGFQFSYREFTSASQAGFTYSSNWQTGSFTTRSDTKYIRFVISKTNNTNLTPVDVTNLQFELGSTATPYMPYGQVYADGTVETINAHGKNLFDGAIELGSINPADGSLVVSTARTRSANFTSVQPNTTYTFTRENSDGIRWIVGYDKDKNGITDGLTDQRAALKVLAPGNMSITFTTTPTTHYIKWYNTSNAGLNEKVQIELGSTATEYTPYYDGGTATTEMLLNIGGVVDEQEILGGNITRKVGYVVLDGTENWSAVTNGYSAPVLDASLFNHLICTHFVNGIPTTDLTCSKLAGSANLLIHYDAMTTVSAFKAFLASEYANGTPVIVLYCLENEITESVAGQTLQVTDGDNVVEITQASLDGLELEAEYSAVVTLTVQEVEDANLDNNVEVTIS